MATSETESPARAARRKRCERLEDVAARAGISVSYLSMIERGLHAPLETRVKLAAALERPEPELWPA